MSRAAYHLANEALVRPALPSFALRICIATIAALVVSSHGIRASGDDLIRLIPNDAVAAARLNFAALRNSRLFQQNQNMAAMEQLPEAYGFRSQDLNAVVAVATYNEYLHREGETTNLYPQLTFACLASSRVPLQQEAIIRKVVGQPPAFVEEGKEFFIRGHRAEDEYFESEALTIHFVDEHTVMFGNADGVLNLAFGLLDDKQRRPGVDEGLPDDDRVRVTLLEMNAEKELIAAFSTRRLQEALKRKLTTDPLLPKYNYLASAFRKLNSATLSLAVEDRMRFQIQVDASSKGDIKGLLDSIDYFQPTILRWYKEYGNSISELPPKFRKNAQSALLEIRQGIGESTKEIATRSATWKGELENFDVFHNAFLIPGLIDVRQELGRMQNRLPLMHIMLASENYSTVHDKLIDAIRDELGQPLLSWRVALLPYLEMGGNPNLKEIRHDEPWDSPHNMQFVDQMPELFKSPYTNRPGHTTFRIVAGEGTLRDRFKAKSFNEIREHNADPAIIIARGGPDAATIWTKPEPFEFDGSNPRALFAGISSGEFLASFSNSEVAWIPSDFSDATLSKLIAGEDGIALPEKTGLAGPDWQNLFVSSVVKESARNLSEIKEALEEDRRFIPPAIYAPDGRPLLSWRVHILPSLGYRKLYDKFDLTQSWDSQQNRSLLSEMPKVFRRPGASEQSFKTCYMLPIGKETVFNSPEGGITDTQLRAIRGFAGTIVLVEVDQQHAVPWTQPVDLSYEPEKPRKWLAGNYPHGFLAATPNGVAKVFRNDISDEVLRKWFANNVDKTGLSSFHE